MAANIVEREERTREFNRKLKTFFKPAIEMYETEGTFRWETIFDFVDRYMDDIIYFNTFQMFCKFLIRLLNRYDCCDMSMVTRIIYLYHNRLRGTGIYRLNDSNEYPQRKMTVLLGSTFNRQHLNFRFGKDSLNDSVENAFFYGDVKFLKTLVKTFSINYKPSEVFLNSLEVAIFQKFFLAWDFRDEHYPNNLILAKKLEDKMLSKMEELDKNSIEKPTVRRIHLIFMVIYTLTRERVSMKTFQYKFVSKFSKCMTLFFQILKEPYVSVKEIDSLLRATTDNEENDEVIKRICNCMEKWLPKNPITYEPRSLLHLSRWQARKNLEKNDILLVAVSKLEIPECVRNYILIKNE